MNAQRLLICATAANFVLLIFSLAPTRPALAQDTARVLRGHALEIVDGQGRVRASITVNPSETVEGRSYPESVLLRLAQPQGGGVKIQTSSDGSGLRLGDGAETGIDVSVKRSGSFVRVTNADGREHLIQP